MEKVKYEKPNFEFQEMKLTEKVAETCWGKGWAWIDHDADKSTDPVQYWFSERGGCDGGADAQRLKALIDKYSDLAGKVTEEDVKVNTKDSEFIDFVPGKS